MRVDGIEPTTSVWKTEVLPLNYTRLANIEGTIYRKSKNVKRFFQKNTFIKSHPDEQFTGIVICQYERALILTSALI